MNFCSNCGSDQLNFIIPTGDNRPRHVCPQCDTIHYSNPKIITGCLPIWENQVLLCKRAIEPRKGYWNIPAGFMENGEAVEDGAKREVWEEAEANVNILGTLAIYSIPQINQVYVIFLGELQNLNFGIGEESLEVQLFTEEAIPWQDIAFYSSGFALKKYFEDRKKGIHQTHIGRYVRG